ncbi:MAG TPA: serine/threonine-protein kinase [Polyangia bacterium]|nr:serine/threonine-protein kinase [Polyangia bacterium]
MDSERWCLIQELFHQAVDKPEAEWESFVRAGGDDAVAVDDALAADVLAMLAEDARGASLLDRGVADAAREVLAADAPPAAGVIGPYHLTALLGEGGMGVVYRAERADVGSVVAVKILRDAWLSPARRERFARERRLLAQLRHPAIAQLHDAGALPDGTPWLAMEYVEGVPITEHCRAAAAPVAARLTLFRQVCEAVQHAHQNLVIHRDLKPSNILVTGEGRVKLLDFGISKRIEGPERARGETRTGLRLMTPAYAAPEQLRGQGGAVASDVYSLGVVLYELLAGRLPFDLGDRTPAEAQRIIFDEEAIRPSLRAARDGAPGGGAVAFVPRAEWADLDVLTLTAMHKDPARRYRTVEALIRDVDHLLAGEPLEARPDDVGYRAGKFVRRNRGALAGAGLAVAAIAALVVFYTVRVTRARNAALAEATRTQRIQRFMVSLFEGGGDGAAGPVDGLRAVTLVDRGVQEARSLAAEPVVQADLYATLGSVYQKLGNFAQADTLLGMALDQRRALFGAEDVQVGRSLVDLASLRTEQARYDDAERLARDGLDTLRRRLPPGDVAVARATVAFGRVLEERGAYDRAIPVLDEAVRLHTAAGREDTDLSASVTELANTHFYAGHYPISESLNQRALALDRRLHGERHPTVSSDLINLGAIQFELGQYGAAERLYREGLAITIAWYGDDHFQTAADLTMLGRALNMLDRSDEAIQMLQRALAIRERVFGADHPSVASTVNEIGGIALAQKRFDDAERAFQRMVEIYRVVHHGDNHYLVGIALANLASVYLAREQYDAAAPIFRRAIAVYAKTLSADHVNVGIARIKLGRALLRAHRVDQAQVESLAGYQILRKTMKPSVSWLQKARQDLVEEYEVLHQPAEAQRVRVEIAATQPQIGADNR